MESLPQRTETALSLQIKAEAQTLGFDLVGISAVRPPPHEQSFAQWLRRGLAGKLAYMERTESLRRDPSKLVPWAVSVISVGMNYQTRHSRPASCQTEGWISTFSKGRP